MTATPPDVSAWVALGSIHLINGAARLHPNDAIIILPLAPAESIVPSNTIVLRWKELGAVELIAVRVDGTRVATVTVDGAQLFAGMQLGNQARRVLAEVGAPPETHLSYVPMFYVRRDDKRPGAVYVHSQVRFRDDDACFIRVTDKPLVAAGRDELDWLRAGLELHAVHSTFLNNHQCYYRKCFPGRELEYKYTASGPVDAWALTVELHRQLRAGRLSGFIMEYRDEFQAWDYLNHLYEIGGPTADRGYVSFIPTTDGRHLIKRKWFADDAFVRREEHYHGVELPGTMDEYVSGVLRVQATKLPSFRRVRYDVNFESVRTGHVFGVYFDHCSVLGAPDETLHQCELEYIRTRTAFTPSEDVVLSEMQGVAEWLEAFLRGQGHSGERGYYSKRSFLNDVVRRRPELGSAAAVMP